LSRRSIDRAKWESEGIVIPKIAVNVSSRRLDDPNLGKKLKALKIVPGTIAFELLESISLDDCDDAAIANLRQFRRLGIDIEIDDFGTGHASIVSLLRLSPKTLKIDRELIRCCRARPSSASWCARSSISADRLTSWSPPKASKPWNMPGSWVISAATYCRAMRLPARCRPCRSRPSSRCRLAPAAVPSRAEHAAASRPAIKGSASK
jgi:hypothetical protein